MCDWDTLVDLLTRFQGLHYFMQKTLGSKSRFGMIPAKYITILSATVF